MIKFFPSLEYKFESIFFYWFQNFKIGLIFYRNTLVKILNFKN